MPLWMRSEFPVCAKLADLTKIAAQPLDHAYQQSNASKAKQPWCGKGFESVLPVASLQRRGYLNRETNHNNHLFIDYYHYYYLSLIIIIITITSFYCYLLWSLLLLILLSLPLLLLLYYCYQYHYTYQCIYLVLLLLWLQLLLPSSFIIMNHAYCFVNLNIYTSQTLTRTRNKQASDWIAQGSEGAVHFAWSSHVRIPWIQIQGFLC